MHRSLIVMVLIASIMIGQQYIVGDGAIHHQVALLERLFPLASFALSSSSLLATKQPSLPLGALFIGVASLPTRAEARKTSPVYVPSYRNYQDYEDHGSYKFKGASATTSTTKRLRSVTKAAAVASSGGGYTATTASLSVAQAEATTLADATTSISTTEAASLSETTTTEAASTTAAYAATTMAAETTAAEATTVMEATATTSASASTTAVLSTSTASTEGESTSLAASTTNDATTTQAASTTTEEASTTSQTTFTASTSGSTTQETTTRAESTTLALLADTTQAAHLTSTAASIAETTSLSSTVAVTSSASTTNVASTTAATTSAATTSASTIAASTTAAASTSAVSSTFSASTNAASTSEASVAVSTSVVASTSQTTTNAASTTSAASAASAETTLTLSTAVASTTANFASFDSTVSVSAAAASASMRATSTTSAQVSVSTTAATLTSSLATATTSNFPAPPTISPAPASASAFYYNASLFSLQTRQQSSSSSSTANFLPLARRDLAVIVLQNPGVPLYVRPQDCTMGNCCAGTDVIPCCSSTVVTDCVNASAGVTCLDTSNMHTGEAGYAKSVFYEIGIVSACQNLIIDLQVTNGDADLYVQAGRLPDVLGERTPSSSRVPLYDWSSNNLGSDSLQFCCNARDGNTPTPYPGRTKGSIDSYQLNPRHTLASLVSFNTTGSLFVQVISWSASAHWTLRLLASTPSSPSPLLPLATHYWMLAQTHLDCSNQRSCYTAPNADISTYSCLMLAIPSLDSTDPYYAYASRSSNDIGYHIDELLPDQVAFVLTLSYTAAGQVPPPTLLENCTISAPDILDAAGNAVFPQRLSLAAAATLTCDPLAFTEVTDTFTSFAELTTTPPFNTRSDIVQGVGAAVTSRAWTACDAFAESLLMQELNATTTTICTETRGTFEYLSDPCCNPLLLLQQCCAPRVEFVSILVPNEAAINSQCATPSCSTEAAHQLGNFRLIQSDPTVGCDSQALQSTHFFAQAKNPLSSKCARYLTWQSGSPSPYDPSLTQCVFDALQEDTFVQAAFASSVLNLSPSSFNSTDDFLVEFERLFVQRYATSSLCKVPGAPFNRRTRQIRDPALDVDAAACAAHSSCNWGFNRSPASCAGQGFRGNSFCGYCEDGWCYELSRGRGCTIRTDFYGGNLAAYCASIGGELMTQEEDGRTTWCYLPAATTQAQCFNSVTDCRYITTRSSIAQTVCAASCAIPTLNSSTCDCTPLPSDSLLAMECNYLVWDATAGRCWHDGVNNQPDCLARGGIHLGGRTWNNGYLDSPGACAAAGGACLESLNLNMSACRGACDVCPNCNESTCSQTSVCSDILTMPRIGACITPPVLSAIALEPECSSSLTTLTPLGCADVSVPKAVCLATNRTWYQPTDNITMCAAAKGCRESSNGFILDNSYRDEASCNNCGGVSYSVFSPMNGTWTPYT